MTTTDLGMTAEVTKELDSPLEIAGAVSYTHLTLPTIYSE